MSAQFKALCRRFPETGHRLQELCDLASQFRQANERGAGLNLHRLYSRLFKPALLRLVGCHADTDYSELRTSAIWDTAAGAVLEALGV